MPSDAVTRLRDRLEDAVVRANERGRDWEDIQDDLTEVVKRIDPAEGEDPIVVRTGEEGSSDFLKEVVSTINDAIEEGISHADIDRVLNEVYPKVLESVQGTGQGF